jgi:hypothetical protein
MMTYERISTKWCPRHPSPPINLRNRIRKWLGKSYAYKQGVWCDCPATVISVPTDTYSSLEGNDGLT